MVVFLLSLGGIRRPRASSASTSSSLGDRAGYGWLAVIAVLMSAVSMFYYLRLVVAMYLKEGREGRDRRQPFA
jgi:NADH-quinone oxidoreductase subunit N